MIKVGLLFFVLALIYSTLIVIEAQATRKTGWIVGDPHVFSMKSNSYQVCNLEAATDDPCLTIEGLTIKCTYTAVTTTAPTPPTPTMLTRLEIKFTRDGVDKVYMITDLTAALPSTFDGEAIGTVDGWLAISSDATTGSVVIIDQNTQTSMVIQLIKKTDDKNNYLNLFVKTPDTESLQADATGVIYNGCDASKEGTVGSVDDDNCPLSEEEFKDTSLDAETAKKICEYDYQYDTDMGAKVDDARKAINLLVDRDNEAFTATTHSASTTPTDTDSTTSDTTVSTVTTTVAPSVRTLLWILGDPHVYSVKKGYQNCNFGTTQSCLNTGLLSITCSDGFAKNFDDSLSKFTLLKSLIFTFTNGETTKTYAATDPTTNLASTFSDGSTSIKSSSGANWLTITSIFNISSFSGALIMDYNSNSTILIIQWKGTRNSQYMLFMITQMNQVSSASGILATGCSDDQVVESTQKSVMWTLVTTIVMFPV